MKKTTKALLIGAAFAGAAAVPAIAQAVSNDADPSEVDRPITGESLDRASSVALEFIGEGRVTGTEIEDEESYYEIEVTRNDGSEVDVQLDEAFNVVGSEDDGTGADD